MGIKSLNQNISKGLRTVRTGSLNGFTSQDLEFPLPARVIEQSVGVHFRLKRIIDLILGSILVIILAPMFILIYVAILIDSPGRCIYSQQRKGQHQNPFCIYKFRTMRNDAHALRPQMFNQNEVDGIIFKIKRDPRITKVGSWLRRFSLDEFPQLINVLKGEMSLVGPRPFSVEVFQRMDLSNRDHRKWLLTRHYVLPGMTGLWQISGRNELPFKELIRLDLEYVKNWSVFLDILILLRTVRVILNGKGAY